MKRSTFRRFKSKIKRICRYWKDHWEKDPLGLTKVILEICIVFGLITYFTYRQTKISERQLELQENQQKITEMQMAIFRFEHQPRFQIEESAIIKDSLDNYMTEDIYILNKGYPINTKDIEIFSFFGIKDENDVKTIFPVKFYYSVGSISRNDTGVLEAYTHAGNCKFYFALQNKLSTIAETYHWMLERFHIVRIEWTDVLGENHTSYFSTDQYQPNQELKPTKANELISLHDSGFHIDIQEPLSIESVINKVKDKNYNKLQQ